MWDGLTEPVAQVEDTSSRRYNLVAAPLSTSSFSVDEILNNYLKLKSTSQRRLKGRSNCK
jgi:hypothetical protein